MQNKKKKIVVPIMAIMVIAISAIGVGYAITNIGETYSTDNTTSDAYVVVTPTDAAMYEGVFNGTIYYDTHNTAGTKTYYLSDGQTENIGVCSSAIALGEIILNIDQVNESNVYEMSVTHDSGLYGNATFYIGYATSENGTSYSEYTYLTYNSSNGVTFGPINASSEYVKIKLFVNSDFHTDGSTTRVAVIDDATFTFTVSVTN